MSFSFSFCLVLFSLPLGYVAPNLIKLVGLLFRYISANRVGVGTSSVSVSHATYDPPKPNVYSPTVSVQNGSGSIGHYDPYAPPRRTATTVNLPAAPSSSATANNHKLRESYIYLCIPFENL